MNKLIDLFGGETNEQLFEKLSAIKVSFGIPIMGDIFGTQSVMYKNVTSYYDIFVRVHKDKIIMGKIGKDELIQLKHLLDKALIRMEEAK